jgi:Ca-activated chloride channel family protein
MPQNRNMNKTLLYFITFIISFSVFGQTEKVKGSLSSIDTAKISILKIYPDSFPNVSVVFKAEKTNGEPIWNLTASKMMVKENSQECDVIYLEQISKHKPINIGIVLDHSGSMLYDVTTIIDKNGNKIVTYNDNNYITTNYVSPLDNAKKALKKFVSTFNTKKDFISVVGFSSALDEILPLSQNINQVNLIIDSMTADKMTALYDAMISGINEIKKGEGIKVLIVLTDGQDNSSKSNWDDVIKKAKKEEVPVYIIGLGDVNVDTLKLIANSTNGDFYFTKSSNSLTSIYEKISNRIQAYYNLIYSSRNFSETDTSRKIELTFDVDSLYLISNPETSSIPEELILFMAKKESEKEYKLYAGIATALLISAGTILFFLLKRKRHSKQPVINNLFPNPSDGNINLDFISESGKLFIIDINGQVIKVIEISATQTQFDLTDLKSGFYLCYIQSAGQQSNTVKFSVQI